MNHHAVPLRNKRALGGPNYCTYPSFYHKALSYVPTQVVKRYGPMSGFLYDFLTAILLVIALSCQATHFNLQLILLVVSIYLLSPSIIFESIGPRSYSLTPRNFAQFMCFCAFFCLFLYFKYHGFLMIQMAAIFFAIGVLSSKFTVQYLLFVTIILSLLTHSFYPLLFLVNIIFWSFIIFKKQFIYQIKGQINHSIWYVQHGLRFIEGRWRWNEIFRLMIRFKFRNLGRLFLLDNPLTRGILLNLPLFIYVLCMGASIHNKTIHFSFFLIWASLSVWFLTQFSIFRAFGEPERYIEYIVPVFLFSVFSTVNVQDYFILFLIGHVIIFCVLMYALDKERQLINNALSVNQVKDYLADGVVKNILCTLDSEIFLFASMQDNILMGFFSNNVCSKFYNYFYDIYPDINPDHLEMLCEKYKITHLIINKKRDKAKYYQVSCFRIIFENDIYKLLNYRSS